MDGERTSDADEVTTGEASGERTTPADIQVTALDVAALDRLGYTVTLFRDGRACVIWDEHETWLGAGPTTERAIEDATSKMFPSRAARVTVQQWLATSTRPTPTLAPPTEAATSASAIEAVTDAEQTSDSETAAEPEVAIEPTAVTPMAPPEPVRAPTAPARSELDEIEARIADAEDDLPRLAPEIQRLTMFVWIARARDLQDAGRAPTSRVAKIATHLSRLAAAYWPGTIPALRRNTTPHSSLRYLSPAPELAATPKTWGAAADLAERALTRLTSSPSYDDGWRDARWAAAENADELVEDAASRIDRLVVENAQLLADGALTRLVEAARMLRWARIDATDGARWGTLVGKLRAFAGREPIVAEPIAKVLHPDYQPRSGWGEEVRAARAAERTATLTGEVAARLVRETPPTELGRVLVDVLDVMSTDELARVLVDRREDVGRLPDAHPERRVRRRIAALKSKLAIAGSPHEPGEPEVGASQHEPAPAPTRVVDTTSRAREIRARLGAGRALFVSNREDPELRARVATAFDLDLEWCTAEPRRIDNVRAKIEGGAFDVVLSATGFQHHATDIALSRAAKATGTLYVRVNRGRVAACERALVRELGLSRDPVA